MCFILLNVSNIVIRLSAIGIAIGPTKTQWRVYLHNIPCK